MDSGGAGDLTQVVSQAFLMAGLPDQLTWNSAKAPRSLGWCMVMMDSIALEKCSAVFLQHFCTDKDRPSSQMDEGAQRSSW